MSVSPATPDDLDAVRSLLQEAGLPADDLTPAHLDHFLVTYNGKDLCGVVGLEPRGNAALLRSLAVAPNVRGEGLGTRLVDAIEERAQEEGIRTLYLLTTTAADYFRARGYTDIARDALPESIQSTEEVARLCPASATCMKKTLWTTDASPA